MVRLPSFRSGSIGRNLSLNMIFTVIDVACVTVTTLIVARLFGSELFGRLGLYLSGIHLISMLIDGMISSQTRSTSETISHPRIDSPRFALRAALVTGSIGLAFTLLVFGGFVVYTQPSEPEPLLLLAITAVGALTRVLRTALESACRAVGRHDIPVLWGIPAAFLLTGMLVTAASLGWGVFAYLAIIAVFQGTVAFGISLSFLRTFPPRDRSLSLGEMVLFVSMILYGLPLMFRGLMGFFHVKINTPILGYYTTEEAVGNFRLAEQFLLMPQLVALAAIITYQPLVGDLKARGDVETLSRVTGKLYSTFFLMCLPLSFLFYFNGPLIAAFFPDFEVASELIRLIAILPGIVVVGNIASIMMIQCGRGIAMTAITAIHGLLNIGVVLLVVNTGGVVAVTKATVAIFFVMSLITIIAAHWSTGVPFRVMLPFGRRPDQGDQNP